MIISIQHEFDLCNAGASACFNGRGSVAYAACAGVGVGTTHAERVREIEAKVTWQKETVT